MSEQPPICMVFDDRGNAMHAFDYTPESLKAERDRLLGLPVMTITNVSAPWITSSTGTNA